MSQTGPAPGTVLSAGVRTFYRVVKSDPPHRRDFLSHVAAGRVNPRWTAEQRQWAEGVSVLRTEQQARERARRMPRMGTYVAELRVSSSAPIRIQQTGDDPDHYTLWGEPEDLLACVIRIVAG